MIEPILGQKEEIAAAAEYNIGKHEIVPIKLPIDTNTTEVYVSRTGWPDYRDAKGKLLDVIEIKKWFSFDGGATWVFGGASTHVGGDWVHRDGTIMTESMLSTRGIPEEKNPDRLLKVEINPYADITATVSVKSAYTNKIG